MKLASKKAIIYAAAGVMLAAVLLAVVLLLRGESRNTPQVVLPSAAAAQTDAPQPSSTPETGEGSVSPATVQAVIEAMERQDTYMRTLSITDHWSGGSLQRLVSVWVEGEKLRVLISGPDGDQKNILMRDGSVWIWYDSGSDVFESKQNGGLKAQDEMQGIITYEDILELEPESILDAGYVEYLGEPCVYAEYKDGSLGYTTRAYISVRSGLLNGAEIYDGDELVYSMESVAYEASVSSEDVFELPEE